MRKGITPVVSVVLLTLMTVGAAVLGFVWINNVQSTVQESAGSSVSNTQSSSCSRLNVISMRGDGITVSNVGCDTISNVTLVIDGELTSYDLSTPLEPGQATTITFDSLGQGEGHCVSVVLSTGQVVQECKTASEATNESGYIEENETVGGPAWYASCAENSVIVDWDDKLNFELGDTITCGCNSTISNELINPGFESDFTGWQIINNSDTGIIHINDSVVHSGSKSVYTSSTNTELVAVRQEVSDIGYVSFYINGSVPAGFGAAMVLANFSNNVDYEYGIAYLFFENGFSGAGYCDYKTANYYYKCVTGLAENEWNPVTLFPSYDIVEIFGIELEDYSFTDIQLGSFGAPAFYDDAVVGISSRAEYCEINNDEGVADGVCEQSSCVPLLVDFLINPSSAFRTDTVTFTASFYNITPIDHCTLTVGSTYPMSINPTNATYSNTFSLGDYESSVECEDSDTNTDSNEANFSVTNWHQDLLVDSNANMQGAGPEVGASGSNIHIIWVNSTGMLYTNSSDSGSTWNEHYELFNDINAIDFVYDLAVDTNNVHIAYLNWTDRGIYYFNSTNGGVSWNTPIALTSSYINYDPRISLSGDFVHLVWYEGTNDRVLYLNSTDKGINWASTPVVLDSAIGVGMYPDISASGDNVHVAWKRDSDKVYYVNSSNNGLDWNTQIELESSSSQAGNPTISASGNNVHVAWKESGEVYYRNSTNSGLDWNNRQTIYSGDYVDSTPDISASGNNIHLVWSIDFAFNNMLCRSSTDNGITWSVNNLPQSAGNSPDIITISNDAHFVWRNGQDRLFYRHYDPV